MDRRWRLQRHWLKFVSKDAATRGSAMVGKHPDEKRRGAPKEQIISQGLHPHPGPGAGADPFRDSGGGVWAYIFPEEVQHVPVGSDAVDEPEEVWEVMRREWLHDKEQKRLAEFVPDPAATSSFPIDDEELSHLVGKSLSEATARKEEAEQLEQQHQQKQLEHQQSIGIQSLWDSINWDSSNG